MTIKAKLHDGTVLEFPDNTDQAVIQSTVKKVLNKRRQYPSFDQQYKQALAQQAQQMGPLQSAAVSAGKGMVGLGRAVGLVDKASEDEKMAMGALEKAHPIATTIGQVAGEAAPFMAAPIGAIPNIFARVAAAVGLGALEGGLVAKANEQDGWQTVKGSGIGGAVAGTAEVVMPYVGRFVGAFFRKITKRAPRGALLTPSGTPTPELEKALADAGVSFDDLTEQAIESLKNQPAGANPEQAARAAMFKEMDMPYTQGDVTQDFAQQATEARLVEAANDPMGDPLRSLRLEQSDKLTGQLQGAAESAGQYKEVGASTKSALSGREQALRAKKNTLYNEAAAQAAKSGDVPIPIDDIADAMPDADLFDEIAIYKEKEVGALKTLLAKYGIDRSDEAVALLEKKGIAPQPLTLGNMDRFRKALKRTMDAPAGHPNHMAVLSGPIKKALDNTADTLAETLGKAGVPDTVLKPLKEARSTVQTLKTEFSPETITGKLIGMKRRGVDPIIEASKVYDSLIVGKKPIEYLERTIASLEKAGPAGRLAMGDLQAATIMELIDSAFKAETRKIQGAKTFGAVPFNKKLAQIGQDRLQLIFKTNPAALETINKVSKVAANLVPPSGAVPKGSGSTILDLVRKVGLLKLLGSIPGGGMVAEGLVTLAEKNASRKTMEQALAAKPQLKRVAGLIESQMPAFARAFGIAGYVGASTEKAQAQPEEEPKPQKKQGKNTEPELEEYTFSNGQLIPKGAMQ
jgi:hypothetical protein